MSQTRKSTLAKQIRIAKLMEGIELSKSGYAGVLPTGEIVDRRKYPDAIPIKKNSMFGIPEPKETSNSHDEDVFCDCCNQPMQLIKKLPLKKSKRGKSLYRVRRYGCNLCNLTKMVFADGRMDEVVEPQMAVKQIEKNFNKEQKAREL